ncbi:hypothetical protein B0J12DRAFT_784548 [Macrophomina phaseolina]|uniref:Major facilitator superfamily (MFS) profile domain-containing protein n=1 Tax=Macrophomina phaseolina TaxID=35725 RepID=A0ABQ8GIU7_9PEZI|nr:hypothetical protein B0J12DRAFT_784548 [Macrophomina phaseolina]
MASSSSDSRSKPFQTLTTASSTVPLRHGAPDAEGPSEQDAQADEKQDWRFWAVFASLSLTSFVCALNQGVLIPAMPSIVHELGGTYSESTVPSVAVAGLATDGTNQMARRTATDGTIGKA